MNILLKYKFILLVILLVLITIYGTNISNKNTSLEPLLIYDDLNMGLGETEVNARLNIVAETLGWKVVKHSDVVFGKFKIHSKQKAISILSSRGKNTSKILNFSKYPSNVKRLLIIWQVPSDSLENQPVKNLIEQYINDYAKVDGFLITYNKHILLRENINKSNKKLGLFEKTDITQKFIMTWYPTSYETAYKKLSFRELMFCGGEWDSLRQSKRYKGLYKRLAENNNFVVYGNPNKSEQWNYIKDNYKGSIAWNGISFLKTTQKHGIALILHSQKHLDNGIPSARIFEAAAASAIIITDSHPFIKKNFGDSVLYIDHTTDSEKMFQQIIHHLNWIKSNPSLTAEKTQKSHQIFVNNFTLEKQFLSLIDQLYGQTNIKIK